MMKDIYIIGASGFGREVAWLIYELDEWNVKGFIDDNPSLHGEIVNGIPVIGNTDFLLKSNEITNVCIAIGNPEIRQKVFNKLKVNTNLRYPNIIARNVCIDKTIKMGIGNIICCQSVLTVNIKLGSFNHINLDCTIGHDVEIGSYSEFGTGSQIIQGKRITNNVVIGASATVVRDINESGTYVRCPARRIK